MKYQEIENKFDRFLIDELHFRGSIKLEIPGEHEMLLALIPYVERYYLDLMEAEDFNLSHNVFIDSKDRALNSISLEAAEELIIKKETFLEKMEMEATSSTLRGMSPDFVKLTNMSIAFKNDLSHRISGVIQSLKERIQSIESEVEYNLLTISKKIALLEELGFYNLEKLSGSDSFKTKITQLITGGSYDVISRNLKNYNLPDDKKDFKYSSFQFKEESKKMISKIRSSTREK